MFTMREFTGLLLFMALSQAAGAVDKEAFIEASRLLQKGQPEQAAQHIANQTDEDISEGVRALGGMYVLGMYVQADAELAERYYSQACEVGNNGSRADTLSSRGVR